MKLDSRIVEGKKPLDCFDTEIAKEFIGKKGLFGTHDSQFANLDTCPKCLVDELKSVDDYDDYPFITSRNHGYRLFLPAEWVKEPEKTYRAYTVMEFIKEYPLGSHLHFRPKSDTMEMHRLIDGYNDCKNGAGILFMCGLMYSMSELYDNYEIFKDGEWKPFGVEVEDVE